MPTTEEVYDQLKQVFDPEIPVNIVDLGLIYDVKVEDPKVLITMTLTSQSCPEARTIPDVMRRRCNSLDGVEETDDTRAWRLVLFPGMMRHLRPSAALATGGGILQVACLEQLYRVFERC